MFLYIGAFQFVPLIAVMGLVLLSSFAAALLGAVAGHSLAPDRGAAGVLPVVLTVVLSLTVEVCLRVRDRTRRAGRIHDLRTIGRSPRIEPADVGQKAHTQARLLVEIGVRVPDGFVLTTHACSGGAVDDGTLRHIARAMGAGAHRCVVRSTFVGEDGESSHAGVFESVRDVDVGDLDALRSAVERVRRSGESARARDYARRRLDSGHVGRAAVLVQRQIEGRRAVVSSRALDGRADVVLVELDGEDAVELDILEHGASTPVSATHGVPQPAELFAITIGIEDALEGAVQLETVHDGRRWWVVQARRIPIREVRRTFIAEGPIALDHMARTGVVWALRGGVAGVAAGLAASLSAAGSVRAAEACRAEAFIIVDGRIYADAALARRVLLPESGVRAVVSQLGLLFGRTRRAPHRARELATENDFVDMAHVVAGLHADQARSVLRIALLRQLDRLSTERRLVRIAAWVHREIGYESATRDRLREAMEASEAAANAFAALSPTFAASIVGAVTGANDLTSTSAPVRVHVPPIAAYVPTAGRIVPIVDRPFEGEVLRLRGEGEVIEGASVASMVVVVPDGSPSYGPLIGHARALVILRGGALSHLATLAYEAGVPTLLWLDADEAAIASGACIAYRDGKVAVVRSATCSD